MILIADCGSTKIDWCLLNNNNTLSRFNTTGMNAVMLTEEEMSLRFAEELMPNIKQFAAQIVQIYFYGAGCIAPSVCNAVSRARKANISAAETIEVYSDLMAAARALCGHNAGIAAIMGTGSNSCLFNGTEIEANVSPLGFILGDEGSGAVIGKLFIGDVLKNQLPADICAEFLAEYQLDLLTIIQRVYREPGANRFLASVLPFISAHIERRELHELVLNSFRAFFRRNITQYEGYKSMPVNVIGSVAYYFKDILSEAASAEGCTLGNILRSPMDGLIAYHNN